MPIFRMDGRYSRFHEDVAGLLWFVGFLVMVGTTLPALLIAYGLRVLWPLLVPLGGFLLYRVAIWIDPYLDELSRR